VTASPSALFDADPLRTHTSPLVGVVAHAEMMVVLGSTQRAQDLDHDAIRRDGVALRRRHGGGGAVLLHPEDAWIELWLPRGRDEPIDVRATARRAGRWWQAAIASTTTLEVRVHDGPLLHAAQGAIACFAAIGPGEVTVGGAKLVGLSQWRVREGTLVSMVLAARPSHELAAYLAGDRLAVSFLDDATSLAALGDAVTADELATAFVAEVVAALPATSLVPELFSPFA
jgi:lipoate---protein ligase